MAVIQHPPASFHSGFFLIFLSTFCLLRIGHHLSPGGRGGEGGRKAEGSSEDFCATITFKAL